MIKRLIDLTVSGALMVPALIFAPFVSLVSLLKQGRPLMHPQERVGRRGRIFRLYKLRSMTNALGEDGNLLPDAERLTGWGRFLRSSSLDELPQLWNVLRGDMSLVGPRPLPVRYLPRYSSEQRRRHDVRPGITGWAQVNGRNGLTWPQKFELDLWYVDHQSLSVDMKILWMTALTVIRREGISSEAHATMPEFQGEQQ
jgi:lipopolysaccharide/colanic/teichoic acid biosynthesis glycosyltransferase